MAEFLDDKVSSREARRIIEALYSEDGYSPEELEEMRQWLAGEEDEQLKTDLLSEKFDELYKPTPRVKK